MTVLLQAVEAPSSAPVTQWPLRILLVLVVVGVIALVLWAMRSGWRHRALRQADIPAPALPDAPTSQDGVAGVYLGTTHHGDWLDRIVVHDLGVRSRALVHPGEQGLAVWREGARDLLIPLGSIRACGLARGIAGKAYERDGVLVVTWDLGGRLVDTGFRADTAEEQSRLMESIAGLLTDHGLAGEGTR